MSLPLFSGRLASSMAASVAAPDEMPTMRPSSVARRRAMAMESSLEICAQEEEWEMRAGRQRAVAQKMQNGGLPEFCSGSGGQARKNEKRMVNGDGVVAVDLHGGGDPPLSVLPLYRAGQKEGRAGSWSDPEGVTHDAQGLPPLPLNPQP